MKKFFLFILFLLILVGGGAFWGYQQLMQWVHQPLNVQNAQLLTVERGTTGVKLAKLLEQEKLVEDATYLPWLLKLQPQLNKIKAGTYSLEGVKTVADLLQRLNEGKEVQLNVRFLEGDTFKTWRATLAKAPYLQQELVDKSEEQIYQLLDLPADLPHKIEGWLYPDTYSYTPKSSDLALLKRAADRMKTLLEKIWAERDADLPLKNPYEMLILASIVERETALNDERSKVASVFINRLNKKMKLQTDPTVIYGMGERYQGNIRRKDLEEATPYNTYVIEGLPPTPIAMPTESALKAVAHPEKTEFLYFVADGTGGHKFSQTLQQHNQAVQEYLRWYRQQKNGK